MIPKQYRQGDVLITAIPEVPEWIELDESADEIVLAEGEVTGHCHLLLSAAIRFCKDSMDGLHLSLVHDGRVEHPEHAPLELPVGHYTVRRQREYEPSSWWRHVAD